MKRINEVEAKSSRAFLLRNLHSQKEERILGKYLKPIVEELERMNKTAGSLWRE